MRTIDADALIERFEPKQAYFTENIRRKIETMPTVEPEIINCRDCVKRDTDDCQMYWEGEYSNCEWTEDDGHCHKAERRSVE